MDIKTKLIEEMMISCAKYGGLILLQARIFVEDETKAVEVFYDIIPALPAILANKTNQKSQVSELLNQVRLAAIAWLRKDPHFDQWALWKDEPFQFSLLDEHRGLIYKELYWYRYFRDIPVQDVAERLEISVDEVKRLEKLLAVEIGKGTTRYVKAHP